MRIPEIPNLTLLAPVLAAECRSKRRCDPGSCAVNALRWVDVIGAAVGAVRLPVIPIM